MKKKGLLAANLKDGKEAGEGYGYLKNWWWWGGMTLSMLNYTPKYTHRISANDDETSSDIGRDMQFCSLSFCRGLYTIKLYRDNGWLTFRHKGHSGNTSWSISRSSNCYKILHRSFYAIWIEYGPNHHQLCSLLL